jgi:hypothetical protein
MNEAEVLLATAFASSVFPELVQLGDHLPPTCSWLSKEDDPFGTGDAHFLVQFGMRKGQFDGLFDLLDLRFETPNVL